MSEEVVNSFNHCPGAHRSGASRLIRELKLIHTQNISVDNEDNPIEEFEDKTTDGNTSVVGARVDASKLVLDYWKESGKQQKVGNMSMNQKGLQRNS